jgi:hypothetical protein
VPEVYKFSTFCVGPREGVEDAVSALTSSDTRQKRITSVDGWWKGDGGRGFAQDFWERTLASRLCLAMYAPPGANLAEVGTRLILQIVRDQLGIDYGCESNN